MITVKKISFLYLFLSLNFWLFAASEQPAYIALTMIPGSKNLQYKETPNQPLKIPQNKKIIKVIHINSDNRTAKNPSNNCELQEFFLVDQAIDINKTIFTYAHRTKEQSHIKTDVSNDFNEDGTYKGFREILENDPEFSKKIAERSKNEDVIEVVRSRRELLKNDDGTPQLDENQKQKIRILPEKDDAGKIKYRYYIVDNKYSMHFESELAGIEDVKLINSTQVVSTEFNQDGTRKPRRNLIPYTEEELAAFRKKAHNQKKHNGTTTIATTQQPKETIAQILAQHKNIFAGGLSVTAFVPTITSCYKNYKEQELLKNPKVKITFNDFFKKIAPQVLFTPLASIKDPNLQLLTSITWLTILTQIGCLSYDALRN